MSGSQLDGLTLNADGTFTCAPKRDCNGTDGFALHATEGTG